MLYTSDGMVTTVTYGAPKAQAGGPRFSSQWLPCTFLFQLTYSTTLCLQDWMMSISALVEVAAITCV